jgi:hypothetical protein
MLAALNQQCHPDLVANAFTMLMLLFTNNMTKCKEIMAFCLHFEGMVNDTAQCKINIPRILLVMFFLQSLHPCSNNLLEQFCSWCKVLESVSLDSIVAGIHYHDEFNLVGSDKKSLAQKTPCATTAATNVDKQGKQWNSLLKWLSALHVNSLKKRLNHVLVGIGICPLCHCEYDKHVLANCPILKDLNLKLVQGASFLAAAPAAVPAGGTLVVSPSPRGCFAVADDALASGSSIAGIAPLGIIATVAKEYKSNDNFHWEGDESGVECTSANLLKYNDNVAFYPSCNHVVLEALLPVSLSHDLQLKLPIKHSIQLPLLKNSKSSNQNLLYGEMSTRSGSNLVLRVPVNFKVTLVITYTSKLYL